MEDIISILQGFADFVRSFFEDLVFAVRTISETVLQLPEYLSFIPPSVYAIFASAFIIIVAYKVLGRD